MRNHYYGKSSSFTAYQYHYI